MERYGPTPAVHQTEPLTGVFAHPARPSGSVGMLPWAAMFASDGVLLQSSRSVAKPGCGKDGSGSQLRASDGHPPVHADGEAVVAGCDAASFGAAPSLLRFACQRTLGLPGEVLNRVAEQADEADEPLSGARSDGGAASCAPWPGGGAHRLAAYPQCSVDTGAPEGPRADGVDAVSSC